jgi:ABC transporter DrrB family efflux protein
VNVPPRWQPFTQLILARVREFYREPIVLFWVYGFPLLLAIVLGLAFSGREPKPPTVDVADGPGAAALANVLQEYRPLKSDQGFEVHVFPGDKCRARLVQGKTDLFLDLPPGTDALQPTYVYDKTRTECVLARYWVEAVLQRARAGHAAPPNEVLIDEAGSRYIDFLFPGLIGMNLMGGGLFGLGFVLVDMRVRKLFKRLLATPMRHSDFLLALMAARMLFLVPEIAVLLGVGVLAFGVPIYGSVATLLLVILLGAAAFAGLGMLLGCRAEKTETISGFINLVMLPSYLFSGIFFSSSRFPDALQPLIQALPLTQVNDALREVMLEGQGIAEIGWRLAILAAWTVVCFTLALRWFRWR